MKIEFLIYSACLLAANAAYLPHQQGVTLRAQDIDILVSDAVKYVKSWTQPLNIYNDDYFLDLKNSDLDLIADLKDLKLWLKQEGSYTESSSMSDNHLSLSVAATQPDTEIKGKLKLRGTLDGKPFEKTGDFKIGMNARIRLALKAEFTPKSFQVVDLILDPNASPVNVEISGLDVDQDTKEFIEGSIKQSVDERISKSIESNKGNNSLFFLLNTLAKGHNLQEVYDHLRGMVPKSTLSI